MATEITESELLAALSESAAENEEGALTTYELAERLGHGQEWVRAHLRRVARTGRLETVMVTRERIDGTPARVPAYRLGGQN